MKKRNNRFPSRWAVKGIAASLRFVRRKSDRNRSTPTIVAAYPDPNSVAEWADDIAKALAKGVHDTLGLARRVKRAHDCLAYGQWEILWRSGKLFSKGKANMLRAIAEAFGDGQNSDHLPTAWNTLYLLARLGRPLVEQLITQGRVHPGLLLREAKALLVEFRPDLQRKGPRPAFSTRLSPLIKFVREHISQWSLKERRSAQSQLLRLVSEIKSHQPHSRDSRAITGSRAASPARAIVHPRQESTTLTTRFGNQVHDLRPTKTKTRRKPL